MSQPVGFSIPAPSSTLRLYSRVAVPSRSSPCCSMNRGEKRSRFDDSVMEETKRAAFANRRDSLEDFRNGLFAELGDFRQASVARRGLEFLDRVDAQRFADLVNSRGRHAGNGEHLEQSLGQRLAELLEVARLAGLDEVANHRERSGAEATHARERPGFEHRLQVVRAKGEDGRRRPGICTNFERALTIELEV